MPSGVYVRTDACRAIQSEAHRGRKRAPLSAETKAKISAANLGKKRTPAQCATIGAASRGRSWTPEQHANFRAARIGVHLSEETKAKIGTANRGKKRSLELRAQMSATRTGVRHVPHSAETRAKISMAQRGREHPPGRRAVNSVCHRGQAVSSEHRAKIGSFFRGKKRPPFSREWRDRIGAAGRGRKHSDETRAKRSLALTRAWEEGRHSVNKSYRYTSLAQALHACLKSDGLMLVEPEVRFGRFTVDLYDREHRIGYEADGRYWHDKNEAERPGYHAQRDAYLLERFGLKIVRFDEVEIRRMAKARAA